MGEYRLEILAPAWNELNEIADYHLLTVGPESARKITDRILHALERIQTYPLSCPQAPDEELASNDYRILVCDKYVCVYRLVGDIVFVYHIAAAAADYHRLFGSY